MAKKIVNIPGLVGIVIGLTLLVSLIVMIVALVFQWKTPVQYSNGLFAAGMAFIVLGILSVGGGFKQRADFSMLYAEAAGQASISERTQRMMADSNQRYGYTVLMIGIGLLLIAISVGIHQLL